MMVGDTIMKTQKSMCSRKDIELLSGANDSPVDFTWGYKSTKILTLIFLKFHNRSKIMELTPKNSDLIGYCFNKNSEWCILFAERKSPKKHILKFFESCKPLRNNYIFPYIIVFKSVNI